ncbi:phospholipase A2 inhibitor gamma subunit B-like [Carettochelys insculpta]|uniref:phospholipase A2 inhibitor gamma subunit B-like n=1 Tax=Carettochelys insculpta TaxID=44489 RepID=UPI003EBFC06B
MKASLAVSILAAVLATGSCLQCEVCSGTGHNCTGSMQPCAAGEDSCGIIITEVTMAEVKSHSIFKGCVPSSQCRAGLFSVDLGYVMTRRRSVICCVGDACKTATVPAANTTLNGWHCPGCFMGNAGHCHEQTVNCGGPESQCIEATGTIMTAGNLTQSIMKGCASESVCAQLKVGPGTVAGMSTNLTFARCTVASGTVDIAAGLLPALTGLLLKLLS